MNKQTQGLLSVHSAVLLFGVTALFSKLIALSAIDITFLRTLPALLALGLYMLYLGEPLRLGSIKNYAIVVLLGCLLATHWITYFHAMQVSSVATGVISLYTYPVITVLVEPFFHREKPLFKDIISAIVVLYGVFLLVPEFSIDAKQLIGALWGVLSALLFALRNIIQRRYFHQHSAISAQFYQIIVVCLLLLPFSAAAMTQASSTQWLQLLLLGVLFTALPHTLFTHSLRYLKAKTVSLIGCIQVVYATLFAALILSEIPDWKTVLGGILVISAAIYETVASRPPRTSVK